MKQLRIATLLLAGAVGLAACSDDTLNPVASPDQAAAPDLSQISANAVPENSGNLLVVFKQQRIPNAFANQVAALGGTVVASYDELGGALVSGLDAAAAAQFESEKAVQTIEPESFIPLPEPLGEPEVLKAEGNVGIASPTDPTEASSMLGSGT